MRFRILSIIFRKELVESLRDRRTLFMMVGLPILLYPLLIFGMSRLQESQQEAQQQRESNVAVWGAMPDELAARFRDAPRLGILPWAEVPAGVRQALEAGTVEPPPVEPPRREADDRDAKPKPLPTEAWARAAQQAILDRKADAVLILWPGFSSSVAGGAAGRATILYDSVRPDSTTARNRLSDELRLWRIELTEARVRERGLPQGFHQGLEYESQNVAPQKRQAGMFLGMMLPYMVILLSVMSGFYASIDVTAGEKERGTMQTLLCAPVEALEIVGGKFLAVWTITLLGTTVNLISLSLVFSRVKLIPGMEMQIGAPTVLLAFVLLLPISMMVTALFLAVGAFARDFKDGQNYLTPIMMGLIFPLVATMQPGIELNAHLAFVPVVNIALLIKAVFLGEWMADMVFLVMISSICYAAIALVFAAQVFERNNVLLGGKETLGGVLDFSRTPGARPTPGVSMLLFSVVLVIAFYASLSLTKLSVPGMLLIVQYGFFLLPALALVYAKGYDWRETLSLRRLPWRGLLGALLIGLSAWAVASGILIRLLPPPESLVKALEKILMMDDRTVPLWQVWLLMAVTPALCEETLFRGVILSGFRRLGMWPALLISGLLFGLAHASIYRLLPTFFLGVLFGYAVWMTGSLWAGVICHALNNGLMALLARSRETVEQFGLAGQKYLPWEYVGIAAVVLAAGLWLVRGAAPQRSSTTA
ncbi:MAG: ABC transporter permease subunit [Bryobacteraceae bacterium]|nr:ABC transporter permease subunit [Bryobacteraceae bacterium]